MAGSSSGGLRVIARARKRERDQPLLDAVMQIPLDAAACLVGGGHDPSP